MSWSGSIKLFSGIEKSHAVEEIDNLKIDVPENQQGEFQTAQVKAAKEAAKLLLGVAKERVGQDYLVSMNGHVALEGQNWDFVNVSLGYTPSPVSAEEAAYDKACEQSAASGRHFDVGSLN